MPRAYEAYLVSSNRRGGEKFWEVAVVGPTVRTRRGFVGHSPPWLVRDLDSREAALELALRQVARKEAKGYTMTPRIVWVDQAPEDLAAVPFGAILYARAHKRHPAGRADMYTIRVVLKSGPACPATLVASVHANRGGVHRCCRDVPLDLDIRSGLPGVIAAAQVLVDAGPFDGQFSIFDPRKQCYEADTEWSTLELRFVSPVDADAEIEAAPTWLRLRRKAVFLPYWGAPPPETHPPDEASEELLDAMMRLCGLGRVLEHSDGRDAFSRAFRGHWNEEGRIDRRMPVYL